jgi:Ca2+-binding RTX toxin-like protein
MTRSGMGSRIKGRSAKLVLLAAFSLAMPFAQSARVSAAWAVTPQCHGSAATIVGTAGADEINGTSGNDVIVARGSADDVEGRGGRDLICGGGGNDELEGDAGNDFLNGGTGNDELEGGPGGDVCVDGEDLESC